jgi:hypothetical protein
MSAVGQANPFSDASEYNTLDFIIARALDDMQTVSIGEVKAVNTGAQTVDVQILVNLVTGANTPVEHQVIAGRPYFRLQGGGNAIICDPEVGDIGVVVFASRDLTGVIAAKGAANPSSNRRFSWSDGVYFGGALNGTPTQYIQFLAAGGGINIVSPGTVAIQAPATTISGTANVAGDTTLQATLAVAGTSTLTGAVSAPGGITTTTIAGVSAVFSGSVTASSFIGGGGGGGSVTSVDISTPGTGVIVGGGPITTAGTLTVDLSLTAYAALALAVSALQTVDAQDSITGSGTSGSKLQLVNDSATPGANMAYGTNGSGTKGWYAASGGTSEPFNITIDTHAAIPTGVGLGPNDEFEGATLDTTGARYTGATPWTWYNQLSAAAVLVDGALQLTPTYNTPNNMQGIGQPLPSGSSWSYTIKATMPVSDAAGNGNLLGNIFALESSTNKYISPGPICNSGPTPYLWGGYASTAFNAGTPSAYTFLNSISSTTIYDSTFSEYVWLYHRLSLSSGVITYAISRTGLPGTFITQGTFAVATYFTTAPDTIGLVVASYGAGSANAFTVDWFRRDS